VTKRKDPSELKIRARDDLTPKPRAKKRGVDATPEAKVARIAALRKTPTNGGNIAIIETQNPDRPLTEKQRLFVKEWAAGESILSASVRAGYADSGAMAYRLAKDPAILKIYNAEKALYEQASQMTRKKVMEGFLEAADMARMLADPTALTGAWREVGKMCGYYEPIKRSIDINISGSVTMKNLERASDADLLKLIKGEIEDVAFEETEDEE
jgi:hypothetical protein